MNRKRMTASRFSGLKHRLRIFIGVALLSLFMGFLQNIFALPFRSDLNRGNDLYKKEAYPQAGQVYHGILARKANDLKARFNLGDTLYKEGKYADSQKVFESLTDKAVPGDLRQRSYYNLGNSFFKQEDYKSAIGAYEEALKLDPKDKDAQFNLELAKKMLAMPKQDRENQKDQQKKKDEKQEQKKKEQPQPGSQSEDNPKGNEQKQPKPGEMSKEDALRILNALEDNEKHKAQKVKGSRGKADVKDW